MSSTQIFSKRVATGWKQAAAGVALTICTACLAQNGYPQPQYPQQYGQQPGYADSNQQYPNQYQGQPDPSQAPDPPSRVARISVAQGNVSLQPAGVQDFSAATVNYPMTTGDRIYTDNGSVTELEAGTVAVRLAPLTDLSVTEMTDAVAQFGMAAGSVHLRTYSTDPSTVTELDTPNIAITVMAPGDLRVEVTPDGENTIVTLLSGAAQVQGDNFQQQLQPGESLSLSGTNPVTARDVRRPRPDGLDRFSSDRDNAYQASLAADADYVNPGTIGAEDLGSYGDWIPESDFGPVWYPRNVAADWQPYSYGHWAYIAPWGWTWVENEPWGFAPFHYGRWVILSGRWGWVPGPPVIRPVYSPALVAFVGGSAGVTAWFPLGPREPFQPWYRTSALYVNRVNVTNIYSRNAVEVHNIYNQRTNNVYINNTTVNRVYVNRTNATVAVPQNAFASGRPVHETAMRLPPGQLSQAPVLAHPVATPTRAIMTPAPARGAPPSENRPPVESRGPAQFPGGGRPVNTPSNSPVGQQGGFGNRPAPAGNAPANNAPSNNTPGSEMRRAPFGGQNPGQPSNQPNNTAPVNNRQPIAPAQTAPPQPGNNNDGRFGNAAGSELRRAPGQFQNPSQAPAQPSGNVPVNNRPPTPVQQQPQPPQNQQPPARQMQPRPTQAPQPVGPERGIMNPNQPNQPNQLPPRQNDVVQPRQLPPAQQQQQPRPAVVQPQPQPQLRPQQPVPQNNRQPPPPRNESHPAPPPPKQNNK